MTKNIFNIIIYNKTLGKKYFVRESNHGNFISFCYNDLVPLSVAYCFINDYIILESFQHNLEYTKLRFGGEGWWFNSKSIELIEEYKETTQEEMDVLLLTKTGNIYIIGYGH